VSCEGAHRAARGDGVGWGRPGDKCASFAAVYLECDAGASAAAVAERVFALEGGDVFGQAGGDAAGAGRSGFHVGVEVGVAELSGVVGAAGERGKEEVVRKLPNDEELSRNPE